MLIFHWGLFFAGRQVHHQPTNHTIIIYQLLAHFTLRFAISVSSSSLAKMRTAAMAMTGEQAMMTLLTVQRYSSAVSVSILSICLLLLLLLLF
jgi:hypothetical protein